MKYFFQKNRYDCGAACVAIILSHFNVKEELSTITQKCRTSTKGTTLYDMKRVLFQYGVKFKGYECTENDFKNLTLPLIAQIEAFENTNHFVILNSITMDRIELFCPVEGFRTISKHDFLDEWTGKVLMSTL
ncbi:MULTISPECIES: cysteine peptidase family C39 domain-containing protein [Pseudolactococcus]|uniref:Peptidase C39 domain-containing protein n=1 Tax=Pseudolactococcus paracarnosus TaxID=2749962 RepID=A0ABT0ANI6_9LACT|nr:MULTISPECIES: cysteine peptidase family C39 domain-containing protein [Lactococcus]MCJ1978093.1 hypothetical protein [Lactococcus paracarnosus]MCJ1980305.1 hypothetical protein [Lactococcus carnosus]MCJ1984236.1 hypothetical protein [Lactococcus paracarnosus]MCJ1997951.1 hypothetical protein [Lactococcus paracarnosus]